MSRDQDGDVTRQLYAYFNDGRLDAAGALVSDDAVLDFVPFGATFEGRSGFIALMAGFKSAFPDLKVTIERQSASAGQVVNECSWTGTNDGPLGTPTGEIAPTHKKVTGARFCEVYEVRDGIITRMANYQDVGTWMRQIGL